jgi:hypothetical protein
VGTDKGPHTLVDYRAYLKSLVFAHTHFHSSLWRTHDVLSQAQISIATDSQNTKWFHHLKGNCWCSSVVECLLSMCKALDLIRKREGGREGERD